MERLSRLQHFTEDFVHRSYGAGEVFVGVCHGEEEAFELRRWKIDPPLDHASEVASIGFGI